MVDANTIVCDARALVCLHDAGALAAGGGDDGPSAGALGPRGSCAEVCRRSPSHKNLKTAGHKPAKQILSLSFVFLDAPEFGLQPYADFGATDWDCPDFGRCGFGLPGFSDPWIWIIRIFGPLDLDYPDYRTPGLGLPTLVGGY